MSGETKELCARRLPATVFRIVPYLCFLSPLSAQVPNIEPAELSAQAAAVEHSPKLDGTLDDPLWRSAIPITAFRQREPNEAQAATDVFGVNPLGTQVDGLIVEERGSDDETDFEQTGQAPLSPLTAGVDTQAASVSFRLRYNYRPDSDLYVIYNEGTQFASIAPANPPQVRETRFAVKYTYSFAP